MGTPSSTNFAGLLMGLMAVSPRRVASVEPEAIGGTKEADGFRSFWRGPGRRSPKREWMAPIVSLKALKPSLCLLCVLLFSPESSRLGAAPETLELSDPVKQGAAAHTDPSVASPSSPRENHWAFRPLSDPDPPSAVNGFSPSRNPVDAFVGARLKTAGLSPAPSAGRRALIRRLSFDLRGLPPAPDEVEAFVRDPEPDPEAYARCVDRYLASPHYGERWGRWWLDLARYADTNGQDENKVMANAWRYRDWVIRALNANLPLDRFITDQLAGDLLPTNGVPEETVLDRWTATGLLVLGPKMLAEQDKPKLEMDLVDEQIDVVTRAFLGLTVGCARCHDHKFDPIPTRDYYALAGIFKSTRAMENLEFVSKFNERPVSTRAEHAVIERHAQQLASVQAAVTNAVGHANGDLRRRWRGELAAALGMQKSGSIENAPAPASAAQDSPVLQRLGVWLAMDSATNPVARALRGLGKDSAQTLASLRDLETNAEGGSGAGDGLKLGPGRLGAGFVATGHNFLELPHAPSLDPEQLTVETWIRTPEFPKDGESRRWLVNKNGNEWVQGHYALVLDRNRPGAYLNIGGGRENVFAVWSDGPRLETNRWHHLAFTYNGTLLRLYVDGKPAGETGVNRPRIAGSTPLALARRQDGFVSFVGSLDEVRVYDRVLNPSELASHVANPESADVAGAVARWEFNQLTSAEQERVTRAELRDAVFGPGGLLALPADPRPWYSAADRELLARLEGEREALSASAPPPAAFALAVTESSLVDLPVFARGSHLAPGKDPVPRGFVQVVNRGASDVPPPNHSGRLELARWLTSPEQPLTARVMVNRVWQAHFGEGLVRTSDNFGVRGELPSHPELMDWLARELIRSGWDLKQLHRLILNSDTYRQASGAAGPDGLESDPEASHRALVDPDNRLLSRFPRQRLEAEMVRDALLAVSGRLDVTPGGSLVHWKNNDYVPADEVSEKSVRRSVYLPVVRDRVYDVFTLFDFANPSVGTAKRTPTVVSHQALFFLNSPLVRDCARSLAETLLDGESDDGTRIQKAYERLFSRAPTDLETSRSLRFLRQIGNPSAGGAEVVAWSALCQSLMASNEFLYRE